jgi:phospholipase/lecithinase/hemolysin
LKQPSQQTPPTGFDHTSSPYPSPSNPLGNPPYPGFTSANGPNWVDFLTVRYNASTLLTYNLGFGGATVDSALVYPYRPDVVSLKQQVNDEFMPTYASSRRQRQQQYADLRRRRRHTPAGVAPEWTSSDALFAIWIGINDVGMSFRQGRDATAILNRRIFAEFRTLVATLVDAGARNFVFVNVPAIDRSPGTVAAGPETARLEKDDVEAFNALMGDLAEEVKRRESGANVWLFDANGLFGRVMDDPEVYLQTQGYRNTTAYCVEYQR